MIRNTIPKAVTVVAVLSLAAATAIAAWGPPQSIIAPAFTAGGSWPAANNARSLAVSGDTLHLVWVYSWINAGNQIIYQFFDGSSWQGDNQIGYLGNWRTHNWYPSCAVDPDGRLHAVWESSEYEYGTGYDLSYRSLYQGSWGAQQHFVSSPSNTWHPVIAAAADGKVYVCWQDDRNGGYRLYYKVLDGAGWSGDIAVPDSQVYASFPSMTASGTTVAIAWQDFRTGTFQIHCKELGAQGWGADSAASHSSLGAFAPCLVSDAGGDYHLAWEDWRDGNDEVYYRRFRAASRTWDGEMRLSSDPGRSRAPVIVCRGDSLVDVFWEDDRSGRYQVMNRTARRGVWGPETTLTASAAGSRCPAAAADSRGNGYLVWAEFDTPSATARPALMFMSDITNPWPKSAPGGSAALPVRGTYPVKVFPNPAAGRATITFLDEAGPAGGCVINVYSITGQLLRTLSRGPAAGNSRAMEWDGTDEHGRMVASGVYLITARQGLRTGMAKVMMVR